MERTQSPMQAELPLDRGRSEESPTRGAEIAEERSNRYRELQNRSVNPASGQ